jgi:transcriptional regulator with XRE-family HTH domain
MKPNVIYEQRYRSIISRLVAARKNAGLTQDELALSLGINQPELSRIETCSRQIDLIEFLDWIKATGSAELAPVLVAMEGANGEHLR